MIIWFWLRFWKIYDFFRGCCCEEDCIDVGIEICPKCPKHGFI